MRKPGPIQIVVDNCVRREQRLRQNLFHFDPRRKSTEHDRSGPGPGSRMTAPVLRRWVDLKLI
jgi:hypothetical protein